ncbi:MAG: hypothetical protein DRI71_00110, partial [Bacteroidetes bacterium]
MKTLRHIHDIKLNDYLKIKIMEESIMGIMWFMLFSIGLIVMVIYLRKYTNIERMALIEKGEQPFQMKQSNTSIPLRFSLLFIG